MKLVNRAALWSLKRGRRLFPLIGIPFPHPVEGWLLLRADGTGYSVLKEDYAEMAEVRFLRDYLQPGMVFLDIGANQGMYSVVAGRRVGDAGKVIAFEPAPAEFRKLRANVRINRLRNVTCEATAIGHWDGTTEFYAAEPLQGGFGGVKAPAEYLGVRSERIQVPLTSLDIYLSRAAITCVDYVKIDVEGGERDVIAGARKLLSAESRPILQAEFADKRTSEWGYAAREMAFELLSLRYQLYELRGGELVPHTVRDRYGYEDLIAVPEERVSAMQRWIHKH